VKFEILRTIPKRRPIQRTLAKAAKVRDAGGFLTPGLACLLVQFGLRLDRFLLLAGKSIGDAHNNCEEVEP
jgi:hypothetical protein